MNVYIVFKQHVHEDSTIDAVFEDYQDAVAHALLRKSERPDSDISWSVEEHFVVPKQ